MCNLKKNYKKEEEQPFCPLCELEEYTREHVLKWERDTDRKQRNIKNNTEEEWEEVPRVVQIFREKKKRKIEEKDKSESLEEEEPN